MNSLQVEKICFFLFGVILFCALTVTGVYFFLSRDLPQLPEDLQSINLSLPTEIYSADGERIKVLGERYPVPLEDISPHFLKAIIAVEDARFYEHSGLDHLALVRALVTNIRQRRISQGGSTITQQLSKNLFFSFERNWVRKIKEFLIALQMEVTFSKEEILEAYCNQIYFGSGAYGVEEAAKVYFGKRARDLTLLQAGLLAGMPNSPNNANPFSNYERAVRRSEYVLKRMVQENYISEDERRLTQESTLDLAMPRVESDPNLYFINYVLEKLEQDYGMEFVHFGGLKIYTTLDTRYQDYAVKAARTHLEELEGQMQEGPGNRRLEVALVAVENKNGAVRAMLGGRNFSHSQFNRAISNNRLPGSLFKPFVYLTAMETLNYSPASLVVDESVSIDIPGMEAWEPKNFDEEFAGNIILKKALMKSINVISAKLIQAVTPQQVIKTARQFGITSPLGNHLSLALGTSGVSPLEIASAFGMIANLGVYNKSFSIQRIEDFNGNTLYEKFYQGVQRLSQKSVYPLLDMMRGVVEAGTARVVRRMGFRHPAAGKTGTTNDFKDAWFSGFTKDLSVTVWVGKDDNQPMRDKNNKGVTGARGAAPIWVFFMQKALKDKNRINFPVPEGIRFEVVDTQTGYFPSENSRTKINVALKEEVELVPPHVPEKEEPSFTQEPTALVPESSGGLSKP